jgi:hypothetical protein
MLLTLAGCGIPSLHDQALSPVGDHVPVFYSAVPAFGALPLTKGQLTSLTLKAIDPDPDPDTNSLYVRLFIVGNTGPTSRIFYGGYDATLMYPNAGDATAAPDTPLVGAFFPLGTDLCTAFPPGDLFVVVSDRTFKGDPGLQNTSDGLTSENHWDLSCN